MAICVQKHATASNYTVVITNPQPATISDSTCSYVLLKPSEIETSPFVLTTAQGAQIGMQIMLVCAIAWGFRAVRKALENVSPSNHDKE